MRPRDDQPKQLCTFRSTTMAMRQPIPKNTNRPSAVAKRTIVIRGFKTSVSLEAEFWDALGEIAASRGVSRSALISEIGS